MQGLYYIRMNDAANPPPPFTVDADSLVCTFPGMSAEEIAQFRNECEAAGDDMMTMQLKLHGADKPSSTDIVSSWISSETRTSLLEYVLGENIPLVARAEFHLEHYYLVLNAQPRNDSEWFMLHVLLHE